MWAASTWQGIYQNKKEYFGKRKVQDYLLRPEFELYDLSADPNEVTNLAKDDKYKVVLESMKEKMKTFQKTTSNPWLIMWDHDASMQGSGVDL